MGYFQNINSLAELKKSYRVLALQNHPDKGGSTETMQQINLEFERLYAKWKDDTTVSAAASGYENDYAGASANEYTEYVYNEYRQELQRTDARGNRGDYPQMAQGDLSAV